MKEWLELFQFIEVFLLQEEFVNRQIVSDADGTAGPVIRDEHFTQKEPVHWMLVSGFLRGALEPPPANWFSEVDLWKHHNWDRIRQITVPADARQGLLFLARSENA